MIKRLLHILIYILILAGAVTAQIKTKLQGYAGNGQTVSVAGSVSTSRFLKIYGSCTVTVFNAGTVTVSTIYADAAGTPKANPFTAAADGYWFFYGPSGTSYNVQFSGASFTTFTLGDIIAPLTTSGGGTTAGVFLDKGGAIYNARAYIACDGVTDDAAALNALILALPTRGGIIDISGCTNNVAIGSTINIGDGTLSTVSTRHNVVIRGASGHVLNGTGAVNPSTFKWIGANLGTMFNVDGPIGGVRFEHLLFDCNALANTAIDAQGAEGIQIEDVKVEGNKGRAFIIDFYPDGSPVLSSVFDNANAPVLRNVYVNSVNAGSSGVDVGPTGVISQLTIQNARFTLQGGSNIGVRLGYTDSTHLDNVVTSATIGVSVKPITGHGSYPTSIDIFGSAIIGDIVVDNSLATWTPPTGRGIYIVPFATIDSETVPTSANIRGVTDAGLIFGSHTYRDTLTLQSNLSFTGAAPRITGDFSSGTDSTRPIFQTSTANSATWVGVMPNGSGAFAGFVSYSGSDPNNASAVRLYNNGVFGGYLETFKTGTGAVPPLVLLTTGTGVYIDSLALTPNVVIGTNAALATNATNGFLYVPSSAGNPTGTPTGYTGKVPIQIDTTNGKLCAYYGGAWHCVALP